MLVPETFLCLQRLINTAVELSRNGRIQASYRNWLSIENGIEHDGGTRSRESLRTGCHFVQQQAKRKQIRASVDFFSPSLLGRHVCDSAESRSW